MKVKNKLEPGGYWREGTDEGWLLFKYAACSFARALRSLRMQRVEQARQLEPALDQFRALTEAWIKSKLVKSTMKLLTSSFLSFALSALCSGADPEKDVPRHDPAASDSFQDGDQITDVRVEYPTDFLDQMIEYGKDYSLLPLRN